MFNIPVFYCLRLTVSQQSYIIARRARSMRFLRVGGYIKYLFTTSRLRGGVYRG